MTIYHLTLHTTIGGCTMVGHAPQPGAPQCLAGNRMPPLPAGFYKASVAGVDTKLERELTIVQPAQLHVIRP